QFFDAFSIPTNQLQFHGIVAALQHYLGPCGIFDEQFAKDLVFQQIRLNSPIRLYRGLHFAQRSEIPFSGILGDVVELVDRGACSSWTSDVNIAKNFASGTYGCILTVVAFPDDVVVDTRILDGTQYGLGVSIREEEVILVGRARQATLV